MDTHIHIPYANNGIAIRKYIFPLRNIIVYGSITAQNKIISENANDITKWFCIVITANITITAEMYAIKSFFLSYLAPKKLWQNVTNIIHWNMFIASSKVNEIISVTTSCTPFYKRRFYPLDIPSAQWYSFWICKKDFCIINQINIFSINKIPYVTSFKPILQQKLFKLSKGSSFRINVTLCMYYNIVWRLLNIDYFRTFYFNYFFADFNSNTCKGKIFLVKTCDNIF